MGLTYDRSGISAMLDDVCRDVGKVKKDVILDIGFMKRSSFPQVLDES